MLNDTLDGIRARLLTCDADTRAVLIPLAIALHNELRNRPGVMGWVYA